MSRFLYHHNKSRKGYKEKEIERGKFGYVTKGLGGVKGHIFSQRYK